MNDETNTIGAEIIGEPEKIDGRRGPRKERTPVGQPTKLSEPQAGAKRRTRLSELQQQILPDTSRLDPAYNYRVVNEGQNGNGIASLLDRGYEIVETSANLVTEEAGKATGLTSQVQIVANKSSGEKGVLMRIRKEYFAEDQADKQRIVDKAEEMLTRTPDGATGGITRHR